MNNGLPIRIAIADDHILVRDCICGMIAATPGFEVCIKAGDGRGLIEQLENAGSLPDVCILDVQMPVMNGYDTMKHIREHWPELKVLVLTMLEDEFVIAGMLALGVRGYLGKSCPMNELLDALTSISEKGYYCSELVPREAAFKDDGAVYEINDEEISFLKYCHTDMSIKEIASNMTVSVDTAQGYMRSLFQKLNLRTRQGLAIFAVKTGLISIREMDTCSAR